MALGQVLSRLNQSGPDFYNIHCSTILLCTIEHPLTPLSGFSTKITYELPVFSKYSMRLSHFSVTLLSDEVRFVIFHLLINDIPICSRKVEDGGAKHPDYLLGLSPSSHLRLQNHIS